MREGLFESSIELIGRLLRVLSMGGVWRVSIKKQAR